MTFKLIATITHKSFDAPVIKEMFYQADSYDQILKQIEDQIPHLPKHFIHNLRYNRRNAFKDARGVKHSWKLEHMEQMN